MERVGVDVVGPFPTTDSGNRWVLTAMDYFTKWPEAYALPDQEAETIVDALTAGMFSRFGAAESIHSDQGRNFESRVFATMCERLGMHKTRTTPLHPQSDGLVERFNKTLGQQLAIVSSKHQRDWDQAPAYGPHGMPLRCPRLHLLHACPPHAGERDPHPCGDGVWSAPG
ncbi:uncharacterized protein K02A2.6-like [Oncorhynchus nerka]|uniref:uncharacterized protein K02A2.6-like n=1 Tax=Oncorhynchus nerka TaxID=8023 RepID=UPI0031B820C5